jgi:NAD(P)-dependent dehydrogenase (short-subunit alcohol dehydrogenase family)
MALLAGKVGLVTGAGSGIGRATAVAMATEGAAGVMVADVDADGGQETVALVEKAGAPARFVATDVTDSAAVAGLVQATVDAFGRLDCAHNNAGVSGPVASLADYDEAEWHRVLAVNLTGVFLGMRHQIPAMLATGGGAIVNTSSGAGVVGTPGLAPYVASKHGVLGLTKVAAMEYGRAGIRVNAVCPGTTRTPMLADYLASDPAAEKRMAVLSPAGRLGEPEEVAAAVVWLCSDAASFVSGHALLVDGGAVSR